MYWRRPTTKQFAQIQFLHGPEDYPEPDVQLWEENEPYLLYFRTVVTQFRYTGTVATGLDYNVVYRDFDDMKLEGADRERWKGAVRIMEQEALKHINRPE